VQTEPTEKRPKFEPPKSRHKPTKKQPKTNIGKRRRKWTQIRGHHIIQLIAKIKRDSSHKQLVLNKNISPPIDGQLCLPLINTINLYYQQPQKHPDLKKTKSPPVKPIES